MVRTDYYTNMNLDAKICYCFHVSHRKLVNFVRRERPKVPSQLSECGGAGTGCGWCIPFLKEIFRTAVVGGETELESLTPEEYEQRRAAYVRAGKGKPPPGASPLPQGDSSAATEDSNPTLASQPNSTKTDSDGAATRD